MNEKMKKDILNINNFLNKRPDVLACYCYGIGKTINKNLYRLIIITDDIWSWQQKNKNKGEFTMYSNMLYNEGFGFIDYIGIKDNNCIFDYTLMNGSEFISDLLHWNNYTFAEIFKKPFICIKSNSRLDNIIRRNQNNTLVTSLLTFNKDNVTFFEVMIKYYSLLNGLSNDIITFVNDNYYNLKKIYVDSKYFKFNDSDNLIINTDLVKQDTIYLPRKIKDLIINYNEKIDMTNVINYLNDKLSIEKMYIDDMRFLVNGALKTISYNGRNNKIKCLSR